MHTNRDGTFEHAGLQTAVADGNLGSGRIDAAEGDSLAVGQGVHGVQSNVEASGSVVNGENVDGLAIVGELPAGTALLRGVGSVYHYRWVPAVGIVCSIGIRLPEQSSSRRRQRRHRCKGNRQRRPGFATRIW